MRTVWVIEVFTCVLSTGPVAGAQSADTTLPLPPVTILETPTTRTGYTIWRADSLPPAGVLNLAGRLLWEMPVDVRPNAPGTLTTLSARGAGPSRTAVFWQGLNLQSPMNGVVDAALIPLWEGDVVEIQYGGQSAALSNGAMAGSVQITAAAPSDSTGMAASAGAGAGSFGQRDAQISFGYAGPQLATSVRAAMSRAQNDFRFQNTALIGAPRARQQHNYVEKLDVQQFNRLQVGCRNTLETAIWYQRAFREIPPAMTEAPANIWQRDRAVRAVATWTRSAGHTVRWQHRLAYLQEFIAFHLPAAIDTSRSRTLQFSSDYMAAPVHRLILRASANGWLQQARVDGYADDTRWFEQHRIAGWLLAEYHWRRVRLNAQVRQEWTEVRQDPLTWTLGGHWTPGRGFSMRLNLSRNVNLPTLNDRFWRALGNPDLRPETGYSADATGRWEGGAWSVEANLFHLLLDDWILWQPGTDGLFRPGNLRQVWSRGLEARIAWSVNWLGGRWQIKGQYRFTKATNTAIYDSNSGALNKILPYTPQHNAGIALFWNRGGWSAAYLHQITGSRYTNSDNSEVLPAFHTGNALLRYTFFWSGNQVALSARMENCWNIAYQILAFRPMPGRSWHLGVQWNLH